MLRLLATTLRDLISPPPLASTRHWRLLDTAPAAGALNMAIDEALMESVRAGGAPMLRFYRWAPACLSLGRNQPALGWYDEERLGDAGVDVVRRPTGGRAVLHEEELTYAVVCRDRELGSPRDAYRRINAALVAGLRELGAAAAIQEGTGQPAPPPSAVPCFAQPVEGEILALGRKLVGSAQVRIGGVLLQHGSLPFRRGPAASLIQDFLYEEGIGEPAYLENALGTLPDWSSIVRALRAAWESAIGPGKPCELDEREVHLAASLADRYAATDWTWRR